MADRKGSHHHWVLARPLEAGGARPPLIEDRHLPHKIAPALAEVQQVLGNVAIIQNFLCNTKINLWSHLATREEWIYIPL